MGLIVNQLAAIRSSRGVNRFFSAIMKNLDWDSDVKYIEASRSKMLDRVLDFSRRGFTHDLFWTPCLRGPVNIPNHIISVHDCINIQYIYKNDWRLSLFKKVTQKIIDNSVKIVALSEATKKSFLENYYVEDNKIIVIRFASNFDWIKKEKLLQCKSNIINTRQPYILLVTNNLIHKNNPRAIQALINSSCKKLGITLRIVGSIGQAESKLLQDNGIVFSINSTVSDSTLFDLYSGALFLFSPTLSEGHNLPIGEALQIGANVLCSDIPAHREFYNGRVSFFNPLLFEDMTYSINAAIEKSGLWYLAPDDNVRTYIDVARDYRKLFLDLEQKYCK
jgi:glycosyltransferase involved in cell wall biosynthesis